MTDGFERIVFHVPGSGLRQWRPSWQALRAFAMGWCIFLSGGHITPAQNGQIGPASLNGGLAPVPVNGFATPERTRSPAVPTNVPSNNPTNLSAYIADDKYKLRLGDRISLQILEDRDLPKSLIVADSGELDVPYLGRVAASDKTCKQLAAELKTQLEKEYYYRATVVIALDAANKFLGRIYVWGQVKNQGPIDIAVNENLTAGKAILRAGGFGDFANSQGSASDRNGQHWKAEFCIEHGRDPGGRQD